ncbi:MAG: FtsX-like permease family protein [Halanaerobiales bacterium]
MLLKILKRDIFRKKIITTAVFVFIMMSALLMASGINMIIDLSNSISFLFERSSVPHFIQYHAGDLDQNQVEKWAAANPYVDKQQTGEMINIPGASLFINSDQSESDTVMDLGFVRQNSSFDYLLDLNNQIIEVEEGEIAVPIYYMQKDDLSVGDKVVIKNNNLEINFTIKNFVRDVQMNSSIVSSKRFVVNAADFEKLKGIGEIEYLISFRLKDTAKLHEFSNQYTMSNLPQKGPTIDYQIIMIMNSLTDGLIAAVIILISLLLNIIALLCLRFIIILTIEEDYKEIGVMKAIGFPPKDIKRIYIYKYLIMSVCAALSGYLLSLYINNIFSSNIMLYIGKAPENIFESALPLIGAFIVSAFVVVFCMIVLRRLNKISPVEAIRMGSAGGKYSINGRLSLSKNRILNNSIFLGLRDVVLRFRLYAVLLIVFILATFIVILPINFLNTSQSPEFITYMGKGKSDIIMDLRQSDRIAERFNEVIKHLENDPDVEQYSPLITCKYDIINSDGVKESIYVETGDFLLFPVDYIRGVAPLLPNEIALSYLSADEMQKQIGDELKIYINGELRTVIVTGIYQDVTNGGRTAKSNIAPDHETAAWYNIHLDVSTDVTQKVSEYESIFEDVKVLDLIEYQKQTLGNTIDQLTLLTITAIITAVLVTVLITSLFLKTLIARDMSQIAIKRSIGISLKDIKKEYITRALLVLNMGIVIGTIISNTVGEKLLTVILSIIGVANMEFIVNPVEAYILSPFVMIVVVTVTTLLSIKSIKEYSISDISVE